MVGFYGPGGAVNAESAKSAAVGWRWAGGPEPGPGRAGIPDLPLLRRVEWSSECVRDWEW